MVAVSLNKKALKKEHFLWQLLNIEKDTKKMNDDLEGDNENLQEALKVQEECELEAIAKKKEQAHYLKEVMQCEKKIAKKKVELDKRNTNMDKSLIQNRNKASKEYIEEIEEFMKVARRHISGLNSTQCPTDLVGGNVTYPHITTIPIISSVVS